MRASHRRHPARPVGWDGDRCDGPRDGEEDDFRGRDEQREDDGVGEGEGEDEYEVLREMREAQGDEARETETARNEHRGLKELVKVEIRWERERASLRWTDEHRAW